MYPNYLQCCNFDHEIVLGNPRYRATLDAKLPDNYFDNPRNITVSGKQGLSSSVSLPAPTIAASQATSQPAMRQQAAKLHQYSHSLQIPSVMAPTPTPTPQQLISMMDTAKAKPGSLAKTPQQELENYSAQVPLQPP